MKAFILSRSATPVTAAALTLIMSFGCNVFAQLDGSSTRFPQSDGPALQGPAEFDGSLDRSQSAPPVFDSLGRLVDNPDFETFEQQRFEQSTLEPVPAPIGPQRASQTPEKSFAESFGQAQPFADSQNIDPRDQLRQPPVVVERARPLPPNTNAYPSPEAFPPAGQNALRAYSRVDIERALLRLSIMEHLLRQQLHQESALRYAPSPRYLSAAPYPNVSRYPSAIRPPVSTRYPNRQTCGNGSRGSYGLYGRPGGY